MVSGSSEEPGSDVENSIQEGSFSHDSSSVYEPPAQEKILFEAAFLAIMSAHHEKYLNRRGSLNLSQSSSDWRAAFADRFNMLMRNVLADPRETPQLLASIKSFSEVYRNASVLRRPENYPAPLKNALNKFYYRLLKAARLQGIPIEAFH